MPSTHARSRSAKSSHLAWSRDRHALTPVFPELASKQSAPAFGGQSDRIIKFADTLRTVTDHEFRCRIDAIRKTENLDPIVARVGRAEGSLTVTQHAFPCVALARVTSHPIHGPSGSTIRIKHLDQVDSGTRHCRGSAKAQSETDWCGSNSPEPVPRLPEEPRKCPSGVIP